MDVKKELARITDIDTKTMKAELAGILRTGLSVRNYGGRKRIVFITENASLSRRIFTNVKKITSNNPDIVALKTRRFRAHTIYGIDFTNLVANQKPNVLNEMGIFLTEDFSLSYESVRIDDREHIRAYIRGCFLATGSISDPDKSYHLEVTFPDSLLADEFINLLTVFEIQPRSILRKGNILVYLKEGQEIVDFLNVIGAHGALLRLENIRIIKDMRNQVNRIVNCETANLEKTVNASYRQVNNINYIKERIGLESLPKNLYEIAQLRLENPDISLSELGKMLNPPLSKSGVNHRLRKLDKIAEDLKKRQSI